MIRPYLFAERRGIDHLRHLLGGGPPGTSGWKRRRDGVWGKFRPCAKTRFAGFCFPVSLFNFSNSL